VAAAIICKLLTAKLVIELLLSILEGNTIEQGVNMAQNNYLGIIGEEYAWYSLRKLNSVSHSLFEIWTTPPQGHPVLTLKQILVVTMPAVAESLNRVISEITWNQFQSRKRVVHGNCKFQLGVSEHTSRNELEH